MVRTLGGRLLIGASTLFAIALIVAVGLVVSAVRTALLAEENLQAFLRVHGATMTYIEANAGEWPRSWSGLNSASPDRDLEPAAARVTVDFEADPREIVTQSPATFTAIRPSSPCYDVDHKIQVLIDALKKYHAAEERPVCWVPSE
ncbi:MAG: hypothetical protein Aurels2KO_45960 [Aureliella sp.]